MAFKTLTLTYLYYLQSVHTYEDTDYTYFTIGILRKTRIKYR